MARNGDSARFTLLLATMFGLAVFFVLPHIAVGEIRHAADPSSLERLTGHLDATEGYLDVLVEELEHGRPWLAKTALQIYTRQISKLHVELGRGRIQKQDPEIGRDIAEHLEVHRIRLQAFDENGHPEFALALTEALSHLTSAIDMLDQQLSSREKNMLKIRFPGTDAPDPVTGRAIDTVTGRLRK